MAKLRTYTDQQLQFILENGADMTVAELSKATGVKAHQVYYYLTSHNIPVKLKYDRSGLTDLENFVLSNYLDKTVIEMAVISGAGRSTIYHIIDKHQLLPKQVKKSRVKRDPQRVPADCFDVQQRSNWMI